MRSEHKLRDGLRCKLDSEIPDLTVPVEAVRGPQNPDFVKIPISPGGGFVGFFDPPPKPPSGGSENRVFGTPGRSRPRRGSLGAPPSWDRFLSWEVILSHLSLRGDNLFPGARNHSRSRGWIHGASERAIALVERYGIRRMYPRQRMDPG